jgi:LacI family transcriptional regulator
MVKPATMRRLAEQLGVSVQTVSNVLRNTGRVSKETALRVQEAAEAIGYRPNASAQALRGAPTGRLGIFLCDSVLTSKPSAYLGFLVPLLASAVREAGYQPVVQFMATEEVDQCIIQVRQGVVDGAVLMSNVLTDADVDRMTARDLPIVLFERSAGPGSLPFVTADYADGIAQAVRLVHSLGARRIVYLDGRPHWPHTSSALRYEGFLSATSELGMEVLPDFIGNGLFEAGVAAFHQMHAARALPEAAICANDHMAVGFLRAALDHGLDVPGDLMITGFDDLEFAQYTTPQLTSVHLPLAEMSRVAAARLVALATGAAVDAPRGSILPTRLVARASTGG